MATLSNEIEILGKSEDELLKLSKEMLLSFNREEFMAVQKHFTELGRNPKDIELETIAQTWSEHCKHKTFRGVVEYEAEGEKEVIDDLLKNTIVKATNEIAKQKGWLVSVFEDNAGIIGFNKGYDVAFKAETHNHPSALDPYGGANTGIGGVIRDILGVGKGAKPIANTDIFCFGPHDYPRDKIPESILHPKRIAKGVRAGVRDYGNRMGIPTVNGAILFDERYLGNPLVYCGTVGIMPKGLHKKAPKKGDAIVAMGARTGRDGIHGVTFASVELEETTPSSPVQIGNPIEEKKFMDVMLQARDLELYNSVTDCGGGGFSSAVGEMAEDLGCEVWLDKAPLKYKGLAAWEIWISESQERMVLAVPQENVDGILKLCSDEDVEATVIGKFTGDGKLKLKYGETVVGELDMQFLHKGVPRLKRKAVWKEKGTPEPEIAEPGKLDDSLLCLLAMPNIASKETTIRQYDHEVQGGAVMKPLVGAENDGPGDAAIVRPFLDSNEAVVISNGINPKYSDIDEYWMAASAIDEAVRNIIAVGGSLGQIALLDNFSWGSSENEQSMAGIVRACRACRDIATAYGTPFISGKDSLYNEYSLGDKTIVIPGTLLISALGVMKDCRKRVSMDLKAAGNPLYVVGATYNELGASHYYAMNSALGKNIPKVRPEDAGKTFEKLAEAISVGTKNSERIVRACHDCSEGGLGVALAEMCFAGALGAEISLAAVPQGEEIARNDTLLFSESNSRFVVEVANGKEKGFEKIMAGCKFAKIGEVVQGQKLSVKGLKGAMVLELENEKMKKAWKGTLNW